MNNTSSWQDFCLLYYDDAMASARYHLGKFKSSFQHWDSRIDEDAICVDAVMEALQKAFVKYDPARGASLTTFLSRILHNEVYNELERATRSLASLSELNAKQEVEYTFDNLTAAIPEKAMANLEDRLRAAILKLSPIDQSILGFFLSNPGTFIEQSVKALGVSPGYVSVHKNRALAKLPALMEMTADDYFELYEDHSFAGFHYLREEVSGPAFTNPVCSQFDLNGTVQKLFNIIRKNCGLGGM